MESNSKSYTYFLAALNAKIFGLDRGAIELAELTGLSRGYISNIASGVKSAGYKAQVKIANAFKCDLDDFLAFGRSISQGVGDSFSDCDFVYIPKVAARPAAGHGSFETGDETTDFFSFRADWIRRKGNPQNMVLMDVSGDSMAPYIMDNDTVMIDHSRTELLPNQIYAVRVEDLIYLKFIDMEPGKFILRSYNPSYAPIVIEIDCLGENSFQILGRVVWWCHDVLG